MDVNRQKIFTKAIREIEKINFLVRSLTVRKRLRKLLKAFDTIVTSIDNYEKSLKLLRENNRNLARALQHEKLNSKNLLQDKIAAESSYHDLLREYAFQKKELHNLEQVILNYDEELKNSMIPNLVKLSDDVTKFKLKNNVLRKKIEMKSGLDPALSRNSWSSKSFNNGNPSPFTVGTVNPMIKGCVIQKPTINVRRVSLPQNRNPLFADIGISSPITEELEEAAEEITVSSRRRATNLSNRNRQLTQFMPVTTPDYGDASGESDTEILMMEPTVRLRDVAQLLENSTVQINKQEKSKRNEYISPSHHSPEVLLRRIRTPMSTDREKTAENPAEGCSWMYPNRSTSKCECGKQYTSPSKCTCGCNMTCDADTSNLNSSSRILPSDNDSHEISTSSVMSNPQINDSVTSETRAPSRMESGLEITFPSAINNSNITASSRKKFFREPTGMVSQGVQSPSRNESQCISMSADTGVFSNQNDFTMSILLQNCSTRKRRSSLVHNRLKRFSRMTKSPEKDNSELESDVTMVESSNNDLALRNSSRKCKRSSSYSSDSSSKDGNNGNINNGAAVRRSSRQCKNSFSYSDISLNENENTTTLKNSAKSRAKKKSRTVSEKQTRSQRTSEKRKTSEITLGDGEKTSEIKSYPSRHKKTVSYREPMLNHKLRRS